MMTSAIQSIDFSVYVILRNVIGLSLYRVAISLPPLKVAKPSDVPL
jgi:hypothetical protein